MVTNVYVDGPDLYYAALRDQPWRWLDLVTWSERLLPGHQVKRVRYATAWAQPARPRGETDRQATYLRALRTSPKVSVHFGRCIRQVARLPSRDGQTEHVVVRVRVKGVDTALASLLLGDLATGDCDTAVVVSSDSDLLPVVTAARERLGATVGLVNPRKRTNRPTMVDAVDFYLRPAPSSYAAAPLPRVLTDAGGSFEAPETWFTAESRR